MTITLLIALCVTIAIAILVGYLEEIGEDLWAAFVPASLLIACWSFIIYVSLQDAA